MSGALLIRDRRLYANIFALAFPIMLQQLLRVSVDTVNSILLGSIRSEEHTSELQSHAY